MNSMKSELERYNDFKKRHGLAYEDIVKIVTEYANTGEDCARTFFCEKYNITPAVFYKCRDFAVTCHLVDRETCKRLKRKAALNCASHNDKNSSIGSELHFNELLQKRKEFLSSFSNEEIIDIANKYVDGVNLSVISNTYEMCATSIKLLLKKGIAEVIIPSDLVDQIKKKVNRERGKEGLIAISVMEEDRKERVKEKVKPLKNEASVLDYQIKNYEVYFKGDDTIPDKEFLINRLSEVQKKYQKILDF